VDRRREQTGLSPSNSGERPALKRAPQARTSARSCALVAVGEALWLRAGINVKRTREAGTRKVFRSVPAPSGPGAFPSAVALGAEITRPSSRVWTFSGPVDTRRTPRRLTPGGSSPGDFAAGVSPRTHGMGADSAATPPAVLDLCDGAETVAKAGATPSGSPLSYRRFSVAGGTVRGNKSARIAKDGQRAKSRLSATGAASRLT
jgi:hypothetical protein